MLKKSLSVLLLLCMVISMFPVAVFANETDNGSVVAETTKVAKIGKTEYETVEAAFAAATNGETVELIADTYEDIVIPAEFGGTLAIGTCTIISS